MKLSPVLVALSILCGTMAAPMPARAADAGNGSAGGKPHAYVLEGNASMDVDADAGNPELAVEWDQWRNRFVHAAWSKWGNILDGGKISFGLLKLDTAAAKRPHVFPNGTQATFTCVITKDKGIENLRIVDSSGDPSFDDMVLHSVKSLNGKSLLAFPRGSKRDRVQQTAAFRIGGDGFHDHRFNDVERI